MAVISLSITQSKDFIVEGIPRYVTVEANIPSNIFYTLDGFDPTELSDIYLSRIVLPMGHLSVTLKLYATNGVDTSPIITEIYKTNVIDNSRTFPAKTNQPVGELPVINKFPFGTNLDQMNVTFNGKEGETVLNPNLPISSYAYDADGNPIAQSNDPIPIKNTVFATANVRGETGPGIGDNPYKNEIQVKSAVPEESTDFTKKFNPKALVIFQDTANEDPTDPPRINRMYSNSLNNETYRDGNNFFTTAMDSPAPTSTFLRSHYNPRTNKITYYYFDSSTNRWLISSIDFIPTRSDIGILTNGFVGRGDGARFVSQWPIFRSRKLF